MNVRFDTCLQFVLDHEGGYSDDPNDHGGATNLGITQTEYDAWRKANGHPAQSVRAITRAEASAIYHANYWSVMKCEGYAAPMDLVLFDTAVNLGCGEARTILARHPGTDATVLARAAHYLNDRDDVYHKIAAHPGQSKWLRGWLNRTADLRKIAHIPTNV
jgi:lysozyme family protein